MPDGRELPLHEEPVHFLRWELVTTARLYDALSLCSVSQPKTLTAQTSEFDDDEPMAPLLREPGPPDPTCIRCSKPIRLGTASQLYGRPIHIRCLVSETRLDAVEKLDRAGRETERARAALNEAKALVTGATDATHCPACGEPFTLRRSVLFQGDQLVHADCWRDDPKPLTIRRRSGRRNSFGPINRGQD